MGALTEKQNSAENEYIQSVKDIADEELKQANTSIEENQNEALIESQERAKEQEDLNKGLYANNDFNTSVAIQQQKQNQIKSDYENRLKASLDKKSKKEQLTIAKLQQASEQAKMKYNLATQKASQAKANWNNAAKILQGLGCVVGAFCPVAGVAISLGGTAIGAIGSANV